MDAGRDGTVVMSRWSPLDTARGRCRRHPQRAPSYGRYRCLVISRDPRGPASAGYLPAAVRKCRNAGALGETGC